MPSQPARSGQKRPPGASASVDGENDTTDTNSGPVRARCRWWAERGLELYSDHAARPEAAEDLRQRAAKYRARLSGPVQLSPMN